MKRLGELLVVVLGTSAVLLTLGALVEKPVVASNPLAVSVTNTPLPVTKSGTWNVGITGTPTVTVGNAADSPVNTIDVSTLNREPFQTTLCSPDGDPGCPTFNTNGDFFVPQDKKLVIEYVSGSCFSKPSTSQVYDYYLQIDLINHHFVPIITGNNGLALFQSAAGDTRLYAGPSSHVSLFMSTSPATQIVCTASLSGYMQPAP